MLGEGAVVRLEQELADASNYGLARSMVMEGKAAGVRMDSPEDIGAWVRTLNASLNEEESPPARARQPVARAAQAKKKNKAKAARNAQQIGQ